MVHLLEQHLSFQLRCPSFLLSKFVLQLKLIQSVAAGRDPRNLRQGNCVTGYRFWGLKGRKSQVPGTQFQGPGCQRPVSQGSQSPTVPGLRVLGVPGPGSQGPGSQGLGSRISDPDFRLCQCQVRVICNTILVARFKRACQILFKLSSINFLRNSKNLIFHLKLGS